MRSATATDPISPEPPRARILPDIESGAFEDRLAAHHREPDLRLSDRACVRSELVAVAVEGPDRLDIGDDAKRAETGKVIGLDDLQVGDAVAPVSGPVRLACGLGRVKRLSNRPVTDGMEMNLEPGDIEPRDMPLEGLRLQEADPSVRRGFAVGSPWRPRYGPKTAPVTFSSTPSCMIFTLVA
jgi:hypothetical protein